MALAHSAVMTDAATQPPIPVARPLLPGRVELAAYLDQIDANRWYSNFGPLCQAFEARLAARFGLGAGQLTSVSNATIGLIVALQAGGASPGARCLVPSWTFSATVHAILAAGLVPVFADVDGEGALTPEIARAALAGPEPIAAVVPVAVYGQPLDPQPWERFQQETGALVVIDAAPAFDCARSSPLLTVVSLHATKILGVGEGGFVMCDDPELVRQVRMRSNFGFAGTREAQAPATNGKLSEYAAALGLAGMDGWEARRAAFGAVANRYRTGLPKGARLISGFGETWLAASCVVQLDRPARQVADDLARAGIETRAWWGAGMHLHPAFRDCPRLPLPQTERLADSTLGLPMYVDMPDAAVDRVCQALSAALSG